MIDQGGVSLEGGLLWHGRLPMAQDRGKDKQKGAWEEAGGGECLHGSEVGATAARRAVRGQGSGPSRCPPHATHRHGPVRRV